MSKAEQPARGKTGFSRRAFLKGSGAAAAAGALAGGSELIAKDDAPKLVAGATSITLQVNGQAHKVQIEPRTTLLEALRLELDLTGAKPISVDGSSGGSTVLVAGKPVSANTVLALECVGKPIQTVESLAGDKIDPVAAAFVHHDASQCGFCTPGFVMAVKAFLAKNPKASEAEICAGLNGNLCRCGTYANIIPAVLDVVKELEMVEYVWPDRADTSLLGKSVDKIDSVAKCTGTAKYSYDINPDKMLLARALGCPHAHCKVKSIDTSAAEKVKGVIAARAIKKPGDEIFWQGDLVACVVGETEGAVAEGLAAIKGDYELLDVFVNEEDLAAAESAKRTAKSGGKVQLKNEPEGDEKDFEEKELARLFKEAAAVVEGRYGIHAITHMCLEPHGSTAEWIDGKLVSHLSTQNVSGTGGQLAAPLGITADDVTVHCDYIGGGFGSKFSADSWGVLAAKLSKDLGRPVKLMLDRDLELKNAGCRPSGFADVKIGADKDGLITVWDSHHWSTGGNAGGSLPQDVMPYVIVPPNMRRKVTSIKTNTSPQRAWRAPNHPQGCALSQTAVDDVAAKLGMDSYDVFMKNLANVAVKDRAPVYAEEMKIAAKLMDWKAKWHPHGKGGKDGSIVTGLGMAIHTWGGGGHPSSALVKIHPDGGVEIFLGSQDLGTGTRTVIAMVLAETFGLPVDAVKVNIGSSKYPASGPSGGSTTVGGVSESTRRTALDALEEIKKLVGKKLDVSPDALVAKDRRIFDKSNPSKGLSWKEACSLLGMNALEVKGRGAPGPKSKLSSSGVAGVQMAEVAVDRETGIVKMKKFITVQDMGMVINRKTAESQIYGAMIMGIAFALFEERIMDPKTGAFVNAEVADYKLPRLGDIGELVVEIYEPDSERARGVIGLGEPPVIGPGAAISNAVANALGVRVGVLPITPKRVLDTLKARNA